jgi:hypothetical protein
MKAAIFAVALLATSPAFADHGTDMERWHTDRQRWIELFDNCLGQYVQAYDGQCSNYADKILRNERNRQARENGEHFRRHRDHRYTEQSRRQWCRNNPAYCADGEPRHYGRR